MKRLLAILLILTMLLPCLPVVAAAEGDIGWDAEVILNAFDKGSYRNAYEDLLGRTLEKGEKSDTAKTVQKVVKAFDVDISTDGKMNSDSFKALNKVQKRFGLEKTSAVTAEDFLRLLACLYVYQNGTEAEEVLLEAGLGEEEYLYYLASYQVLKKQYYRAKCNFEDSGLYDAYERAEDCEQDWPKDSRIWKSSSLIGSGTKLTVKVENSSSEEAHVVKIYNSDNKLVAVLFIGGNGKASTSLKPGKYIIKIGEGETWYGRKDSFGREGSYSTLKSEGSKKIKFSSNYEYTLTLGVYGGNAGSEYEDYDNF